MEQNSAPSPPGSADQVLSYLCYSLPGYPFDPNIDNDFVQELLDDFPRSDVLEEIKAWRWYHDNQPAAHTRNVRLAIRRWILNGSAYSSR